MDDVESGNALVEVDEQPVAKKPKSKKLLIGAAGAVLLALVGVGATVMLGGGEKTEEHAEASEYVEVPAMLINIRSADGRQRFLKVRLTLETTHEAKEEITAKMPAVIDSMQNFLRELRPEDLSGSSAMFRMKEELLVRASQTVGPDQVTNVLIQEMVQQ